jgi:hypothetical protein
MATYRDENGNLHTFSPVSPQLGDVPYAETHMRRSGPARVTGRGSMHSGCVVNGLAISDLERAKLPGC